MNITTTIKEYALKYLPECITALIVVALFGVYMTSFAAVNTRQPIVFQGRLTDTSYVPSPDGAYPMKFKIWDAASGGNCLWATGTNNNDTTGGAANCPTGGDLASPVTVSRGVFSVRLGDTSSGADNNPAINLDFNSGQYYLEITVGPISGSATDTLSPRVRIGGAPYSYNADLFDALDSNQFVRSDRVAANTTIAESTSYINPASAITDSALLGVAVGGTEKFRIDAEGDVDAAGKMRVGSITAPVAVLDVNGNVRTTGKATAVITGSIDPAASTAVVGVSTLFTKELVVGDRITVSGETRTITAITDDTNLTVDTAFTDNSNDTTVDALYALATFNTSTPTLGMVINDQGRVGLGVTAPSTNLDIAGLTINTDDDNTIAGQKVSGTFTKNDTNTRTFSVLKTVPTFNFGGSNTTTTVNVLDLDSTNTSVVGLTTNLIKASYGGSQKMVLDSSGNLTVAGNLLPAVDNTQDIGTSALRWKTLHVGPGSVVVHNDATNADTFTMGYNGADARIIANHTTASSIPNLQITTGSNTGLTIKGSNGSDTGFVGVNTAAPGSALDVKGTLRLSGSTSGYVGFAPAAAAGSTTYTLPSADGSNGQVLTTNGGGVLSWTTPSGGGGGGIDHSTTVDWFDDFIGGGTNITTDGTTGVSDMNWAFNTTGSGVRRIQGFTNGLAGPIGVYNLTGGSVDGDYASLTGNSNAIQISQTNYTVTTRLQLWVGSLTGLQVRAGLSSNATTTAGGVYFEINPGTGNWRGVVKDAEGGTQYTAVGTEVTPDIATFHVFKIVKSGGSGEFFIDNVSLGTVSSWPSMNTPMSPIIYISSVSGANSKQVLIDYYGLSVTGLTR